jgi:CRISPR-associated protein Csx10
MSLKLTFNITLKSDYHISAGHGKGALIDSALLRDGDGVPVIRGTTLTGLLRDGLWRLLQTKPLEEKDHDIHGDEHYCGQYATEPDPDLCPLCRLFGTPRRPKAWRISSARPETNQEPVSGKHQPEGQPVARVRINPRTRRAEPRKLFSQEEGDGRWAFQFTVTWPTDNAGNLDEAALLTAAARNVRQLGRSRRRGQGECLFTLIEVEGTDAIAPAETDVGEEDWQTPLLERFARRWIDGKPASPSKPSASLTIADEPSGDAPVRVRLFVRTDEPLLIAKRAEAGNQFESLSVITGQVIRGALAWRAARRYDLSERESKTYKAFAHTFLRDDVLFPDLYPAEFVAPGLRPTIPVPRDLLTCKIGGFDHGFWFATEGVVPEECKCGSKAFTEVKGFVKLSQYAWPRIPVYDKLERSSEMHIRIDQEKGRVSEGDLFGYVALDAGQYFIGDLICADEAAWKRLQALAHIEPDQPIELRLGKARRRGYGKVTAWFQVNLDEDEREDVWIRRPLEERVDGKQCDLRLTLLTDTIITDRWGRFATGFESSWLSEVLEQNVEIISVADGAHTVDGFDANLGLPRWRDIALSAGSTVRLELTNPPDLDLLHRLEQQGIGLRRNEGFGRVAFNHPVYSRCQGIASDLEFPQALKPKPTRSSDEEHFRDEWISILDKEPWSKKCKDQRFTAVARLLHTQVNESPEDNLIDHLLNKLRNLGEPDAELIEVIDEYGDRGEDNFFKKEGQKGGKEGLDIIRNLLDTLKREDDEFWPLGIQMLAERIAAAVETKKEE